MRIARLGALVSAAALASPMFFMFGMNERFSDFSSRFSHLSSESTAAAASSSSGITVHPIPDPTGSARYLPNAPVSLPSGNTLSLTATPGEFESVSFLIQARSAPKTISLEAGNLTGPDGATIPSNAVDIRVVKAWYQAGDDGSVRIQGGRYLVPELLLKDDALIRVDGSTKTNWLRADVNGSSAYLDMTSQEGPSPSDIAFSDSNSLLPFGIEAGGNRQIWITVAVPKTALAGNYSGTITVRTANGQSEAIAISARVLPFFLATSMLKYSLYYHGLLNMATNIITSSGKTREQVLLELADMRDHGVLYPGIYSKISDVGEMMDLMKQTGLPTDALFILGRTTGKSSAPASLAKLAEDVRQYVSVARGKGFQDIYFYGVDEATPEVVSSEIPAWQTVHDNGGKVFVAGEQKVFSATQGVLDVVNLHRKLRSPEEVSAWHNQGTRVFSYSNPQVGVENPSVYRRNYGLTLALAGYDGAMDYAYQRNFGYIWNDFDHTVYRDHVFSYPTSNGLVGTIEWEGFREGVDDVRYLSTLIAFDQSRTRDQILSWARGVEVAAGGSSPASREAIIQAILALPAVSSRAKSTSVLTPPAVSWQPIGTPKTTATAPLAPTTPPATPPLADLNNTPVPAADLAPPSRISGLSSVSTNQGIRLVWTNPTDADFDGVLIVRSISNVSTPLAPAQGERYRSGFVSTRGTVVYVGKGTEYTDLPPASGTPYVYEIFSFDARLNYASAASVRATSLVDQTSIASPGGTGAFGGNGKLITGRFAYGTSAPNVAVLQSFLAGYPALYPEGLVTGYYGYLTLKAVARFQKKYGIVSSGGPSTTGFGIPGPITRAKMNELILKQ